MCKDIAKSLSIPKIDAESRKSFEQQFRQILGSPAAKQEGVVYIWRASKPIPRLRGESDVIYIGKTSRSLYNRYSSSRAMGIECAYFESVYAYLIKQYGPIRIEILESKSIHADEAKYLTKYFEEHCELPPTNRSLPSVNIQHPVAHVEHN